MGDRREVIFIQEKNEKCHIRLYTHWNGSEMPELLQEALRHSRSRWGDPFYGTRMIVSYIIHSQDDCLEETGWGLSTGESESEYWRLVVDFSTQSVKLQKGDYGRKPDVFEFPMSFKDFIETENISELLRED